jgi:hypothetical protein
LPAPLERCFDLAVTRRRMTVPAILEKTGVFPALEMHALEDKIGVQLVVLYVVIGSNCFPWSFLIWRGKNTPSPT